jgi:hypothetical protein
MEYAARELRVPLTGRRGRIRPAFRDEMPSVYLV